ncbi:MAG: hypothetical protein M5U10_00515 [Candidatus Methanoperedens sp.]|nr:hypothetical protein [Candidatus Methanoperedens nitroreducens]MDJ1420374.1 hypothetical protein [Candidatus Methanoperedens sp.]
MKEYYRAKMRITSRLFYKDFLILILVLSLIILPSILGLIYIKLFGVNIVFWDQWAIVPLIKKLYTGALTLDDLFAQHNEHRIFFPRITMLALAHITQYNTIAEMYFSWIIVFITLFLILKMYIQDFGSSISVMIKFIPIAWLIFNFRQFENILWGWQISAYLSILGFVAAVYMLDKSEKINNWFIMAIFSGIISTFSFFNGLFVWPVGLVFIILSKINNKISIIIVWTISGILIWSAYFYNWIKPSHHPSLFFAVEHLISSITYLIVNIGAPLAFEQRHAFGTGIILSIFIIISLIFTIRNRYTAENAKWICFILFSFLSSAALTIGRSGFGVEQGLSSRYVTFTLLGVIGVYLIILHLYSKSQKCSVLYGMILSIILVGITVGYVDGVKEGGNILEGRKLMVNNLIDYEWTAAENLKMLYPNEDILRERAKILEEYKLNVFTSAQIIPEWQLLKRIQGGIMAIDYVGKKLYVQEINVVNMDKNIEQFVEIRGWAADDLTKDGEIKTFLVFRGDSEEIVIPTKKTHRPDVASYFGVKSYEQSGWSAILRLKEFEEKCYNISLRILRANGEEYFELAGDKPICFI